MVLKQGLVYGGQPIGVAPRGRASQGVRCLQVASKGATLQFGDCCVMLCAALVIVTSPLQYAAALNLQRASANLRFQPQALNRGGCRCGSSAQEVADPQTHPKVQLQCHSTVGCGCLRKGLATINIASYTTSRLSTAFCSFLYHFDY